MTPDDVVRCRPPRSSWLLLVFPTMFGSLSMLSAFAATPQGPPSPGETLFFLLLSLLCLLGACVFAWWMLRAGIIAGDDTLQVRGFGGWKCMRWNEVSDFYQKPPVQKRSAAAGYVLETLSRKVRFSGDWSSAEALRELISQNAVRSRVSEWEIKGTRAVDLWPVVFGYNTWENRWAPRLWLKLFGVFVVYLVVQPALQFAATANVIGWAAAVLYLLLIGSVGSVFLLPLAQYRAANRRKAEQIAVDLGGVVFRDGARRLEAAWSDVINYRVVSSHGILFRFIVETRQGEFDFLSNLGNARLLQAITQRYAVAVAAREWQRGTAEDVLGGEVARWSGGKIGTGTRFYHYRTRGHRAVLLGSAFLGVVFGLMFASSSLGWLPGTVPPTSAASATGIGWGAALLLGWRAYLQNGVAAGEKGLTQRTLFGERFLAWEQVQEYDITSLGGKVSGRGRIIGFSSEIAGCAELKSEIARRAVNAVGTRTKTTNLAS